MGVTCWMVIDWSSMNWAVVVAGIGVVSWTVADSNLSAVNFYLNEKH